MPHSAFLRHPFRATLRLLWLMAELLLTALDYPIRMALRGRRDVAWIRALWLQRHCRRVARVLDVAIETKGSVPNRGLLACNHLSYLDILVLGSITPSVFVAKREVRRWPVFGLFAHLGGTVFVHREKRSDAVRASSEIRRALERGSLVVLFPEGTSTGGHTVLPFKSALFREADHSEFQAFAGCIRYALPEGDVAEEICFWRDMALVPHLLNLLGRRKIQAKLSFAPMTQGSVDRKLLSHLLHREVLRMHSEHSAGDENQDAAEVDVEVAPCAGGAR